MRSLTGSVPNIFTEKRRFELTTPDETRSSTILWFRLLVLGSLELHEVLFEFFDRKVLMFQQEIAQWCWGFFVATPWTESRHLRLEELFEPSVRGAASNCLRMSSISSSDKKVKIFKKRTASASMTFIQGDTFRMEKCRVEPDCVSLLISPKFLTSRISDSGTVITWPVLSMLDEAIRYQLSYFPWSEPPICG